MSVTLRPYQETLVSDIRGAFRQQRRVLAVAPTGAGKTATFAYIATHAAARGNRVVILAHRIEIVEQISIALDRMGVRHGRIMPGQRMTDDPVQVAMVQTLGRRLDQVPEPALLVVDECVSGDALVATEIGDVPMRDVPTSGARFALSWDGKSHVWRPITAWWKSGNRSVLRVHLSNGKSIVCTPDHLFYVDGQWQQAKSLEIGAELVSSAAFADVAAGRAFSEISVAAEGSTSLGIGHGASAQTGAQLTPSMCVGPRSAAVDAESASSPLPIQRTSFSTFTRAVFAIRGMCMGITEWLGGIATTATEAGARPISIRRDIPSTKPIPSGDGSLTQSARAASIRTATGSQSSGSHSQQASECSSELPSSFPRRCDTNCLTVTGIEDAGSEDVFDITVEGTHCFFANGALVHNCHHATAGAWRLIADTWTNARILGVTATPARLDGKPLGECFDVMVLGPTMAELIEAGFLARYTYLAPPEQVDFSGIKTRGGDFAVDELAAVMDKAVITGDAIGHYRTHLNGRPAIAFCVTVEHAEHVAAEFVAAGFRAASVDGSMDRTTRRDRIAAIGDGRLNVLTSCNLISEGTDIPVVSGAILLRPTKSLGLHLQQVGRVLRPKPDGSAAIVLDHVGNVHRHGMPDAPREWSLTPPKRKKKEAAAPVAQCEQCFKVFAVAPGWRADAECPESQPTGCILTVPPSPRELPEQVEGELVAVIDPWAWTLGIDVARAAGAEFRALIELADTPEKLKQVAKLRGYHHRWVQHQLRARAEQPVAA